MKNYMKKIPTPSYVVEAELIRKNLEILKRVKDETGCKILLAQKAFSMYYAYPLISEYLDGTTASGLHEAKLGYEEFGKETHVFSPAYREDEINELYSMCQHMIFNSKSQWERFGKKAVERGILAGVRINPECSTQEGHGMYDPCAAYSRLGVTRSEFKIEDYPGISGLHFHTLCEQNVEPLIKTVEALEEKFGEFLPKMKWLNLGGGHHITREDYDVDKLIHLVNRLQDTYDLEVYLEPGEAVVLNAGFLVSTVLDVTHNGMDLLLLDTSASCHMPDVLEVPYKPKIIGGGEPGEKKYTYRLGGPTCLAGDVIGDYSFDKKVKPGDRLVFCDMALYTMVKNNTFNGMRLPSIVWAGENGDGIVVKEFGYQDFKMRLS